MRMKMKRRSSAKCRLLFPPLLGSPELSHGEDRDLDARSLRNVMKIQRPLDRPVVGAPAKKNPTSLSDVKERAASRMDSIRKSVDRSYTELLRDLEASNSRLFKRVKLQTQSFMEAIDEADRHYRKASDMIKDNAEDMKASFAEFVAETQATSSPVKVSIQEIAQSFEKAIQGLHCRYGLS